MTQPSNNSGLSLEQYNLDQLLTMLVGAATVFERNKNSQDAELLNKYIATIEANYISRSEVAKALEAARLDEIEMVMNNALSTDLAWKYLNRREAELKKKWGIK